MRLPNRIAIVTGGGRGLGRAAALALAGEGADVAVVVRTAGEIEATAEAIRASGRRALAIPADVSDAAAVEAMAQRVVRELGAVDILVNNAGVIGPLTTVADTDSGEWSRTLATNLTGTFLCSRAVLPTMMARRRGKIVNVSSGLGARVMTHSAAYSVSKAGVDHLTRILAAEMAEYDIQVNAVTPAVVDTRMQAEIRAVSREVFGEANYARFHALKEQGELLPPEEPARLILFLCLPESDGISGQVLSYRDPEVHRRLEKAGVK